MHPIQINFCWLSMVLTCCHSLNAILGFCLLVFYLFTNLCLDASWILVLVGSESTLLRYILDKKMYFLNTFCIILVFLIKKFHLLFWETHKMKFWQKISNTILVTIQIRVIFKQTFMFSHTYTCLNEKPHPNIFSEITWMELFIWYWNDTFNSYSIYE
jgi:hypothetical protein